MMTRAEIQRHVRGILRLRESASQRSRRESFERGHGTYHDFNPNKRRGIHVTRNNVDAVEGAVDDVFAARERSGRLPRGSW